MGYCTDCLYSKYYHIPDIHIHTHVLSNNYSYLKCGHENSAYYDEIVASDNTCRLFVDSVDYIKRHDRIEKIKQIKENENWRNINSKE